MYKLENHLLNLYIINLIYNMELLHNNLMDNILGSDCVVFNAYQTLENDHSIWTTKIQNFDEELALERFKINCFGISTFLKSLKPN